MKFCNSIIILLGFSWLYSCASYNINIRSDIKDPLPALPDSTSLIHTMYSVGNLGDVSEETFWSIHALLKKELEAATEESSFIFLGDNVGRKGFSIEDEEIRQKAKARLNPQLDLLKNFKGKAFMIPGENEWKHGRDAIEELEDYVQDYSGIDIKWEPDHGCSGPDEEDDLNENLSVVFLDSHWWLMNWNHEPELNIGCENRSKDNFLFYFEDVIKKNRRKNTVVVMHHPLFSKGRRGGYYSAKEQLFPFKLNEHKILYLPLPAIGSAIRFFSSVIGSRQDLSHPEYHALREGLISPSKKNGEYIFLSAHEKNLQYLEKDKQKFIIGGAGVKKSPTKQEDELLFGYAAEVGYSKLSFYEDGSVWLEFIVSKKGSGEAQVVFRKKIKDQLRRLTKETPEKFPLYESKVEEIETVLNPQKDKSNFHQFIWGEHYRKAYHEKIKVPLLDLSTYKGGLNPIKRGGGYQTNSLRLQDSSGHEYVIRSILKDPSLIIPHFLSRTFVQDIFEDQFTSAHPFGALLVPQLAQAIGVYHTNPKLFYLPAQPNLERYNEDFAAELYLFEERPDDNWESLNSFGNPKEIISTLDLLEKMEKDDDHRVDQRMVLRNRLFSNLLGDLDRHDDQFRWAKFEQEDGTTLYQPIPRDRDQVFAKFDGLIPGILHYGPPPLKQLTKYTGENTNIKWINYSGRYFDPTFLSEMSWEDFRAETKYIQEQLSDSVIEQAFNQFPEPIARLNGAEISSKLKGRRDNLLAVAKDFYDLVSQKVDVVGTYGHEFFEVIRFNDGRTQVSMYDSNGDGEKEELLYKRIFFNDQTEEIRLYGLADDDFFHIKGQASNGILIRCIGGKGKDSYRDESKVQGIGKKTKIYDSPGENHLSLGSEAKDKTSKNPRLNTYNRRSSNYEFDYSHPIPVLSYNPDDGIIVGTKLRIVSQGHLKSPYGQAHTLGVDFASATKGMQLSYDAELLNVFGKWDLVLRSLYSGARYTRNFFGLGNDSPNEFPKEREFNRVQQKHFMFSPILRKFIRNSDYSYIAFAGILESSRINDLADRYINSDNIQRDEVFDNQLFAGADVEFNFFNADREKNPTHGMHFNSKWGSRINLQEKNRRFSSLDASFTFYTRLGSQKIVLASRVGASHRFGNDFEFYQASTLGGSDNLRSYRDERFSGKSAFYHNSDLRISFVKDKNYYVPFTLGLQAGFDYGRVWLPGENSERWYTSTGGGIWINPFSKLLISSTLFFGSEGTRLQLRSGFFF